MAAQPTPPPPKGTLTFVLGLAGSGKSWLMERMTIDHRVEDGFGAADAHETHHTELIRQLKAGKHCAISELQFLCVSKREEYLKRLCLDVTDFHLNWVCFENDVASANSNCLKRPQKGDDADGTKHAAINDVWSKVYVLPEGAIVLKIHRV